ncbi:MAG: ATP-binding protein [Chloroflexota bacterium]|nr:ATP-binding protein [Chloroflexota bacterium]
MSTRLPSMNVLRDRLPRFPQRGTSYGARLRQMVRARWADSGPSSAGAAVPEPIFEILVGTVLVLVPLAILLPMSRFVEPTMAGILLMVSIALATHLGEWLGALTSIVLSVLAVDLIWISGSAVTELPSGATEIFTLIVIGVAGLVLAWLIQEVKGQSMSARRDAQAARSATFALNSIEADAAAYARGGGGNRTLIYGSLLRAMVAANRTAFGVLFLVNELNELVPMDGYGLDAIDLDDLAPEFLEEILEERRLRTVPDIAMDSRFDGSEFQRVGVRSLMGTPIFTHKDMIAGIVVTGLHATHAFTSAEEYRLAALTDKAGAIFEALEAVDERELALRQAETQQQWLERVVGAIPEAVIVIDPEDESVMAQNEAALRLLGEVSGYGSSAVHSRLRTPDGDLLTSDASPISRAMASGNVVSSVELLAIRPDHARIPVLVSAAPVADDDVPMAAIVAVFREISALKEAARLKDEFVSVVSHELRSPLTPIRGFVQLVARDLARKGGHDESVQRLNSAAGHVDRMTRLVDDLLDVSRLKAGLLDLKRAPVSLGDISREVIRDRTAGGAGRRFVLDDLPFDVVGNWDADRIYQVIDNLVGNAIKYSPDEGVITLTVNEDPATESASITISDEGPGIAQEEREQIFSAFFRTKSASKSQVAGLGLGLYICNELVTAHGGQISVHEAESGGAAFTVTLPLAMSRSALVPAAAAS